MYYVLYKQFIITTKNRKNQKTFHSTRLIVRLKLAPKFTSYILPNRQKSQPRNPCGSWRKKFGSWNLGDDVANDVWLVVEPTHLKHISEIGSIPQIIFETTTKMCIVLIADTKFSNLKTKISESFFTIPSTDSWVVVLLFWSGCACTFRLSRSRKKCKVHPEAWKNREFGSRRRRRRRRKLSYWG